MNRSLLKQIPFLLGLLFLFLFALSPALRADTITIQIGSYIDGRDLLYIQGNTLRWQTISSTPVGVYRSDARETRTSVTTWLNGVLEQSTKWQPTYPSGSTSGSFTDAFTLFPTFPTPTSGIISNVLLTVNSGRGLLSISQTPTQENGDTLILDFKDAASGAAWYQGTVTVTYTPIPEPASLLLLGSGMLGLATVIRRKIARA